MQNSRNVVALILGPAMAALVGCAANTSSPAPKFDTEYQAVLLDTGLVYYGKISGLDTTYPLLKDVYYIQQTTDPQTKQTSSVLIRRGNEFHGPDETVINASHIVLIEPVGANSKVAQLIAEQQKQGKQPSK
jgi:hypothetical protein